MKSFDPVAFRKLFPAIGDTGVYLDSAATALKPQPVIDTLQNYYTHSGTTVHRSQHQSAQDTTAQFELARRHAAHYLHASDPREIIWTRGTTEAINLVAQSYARPRLRPNDEILVCESEHHANLIPWFMVAEQTGANIVKLPLSADLLPDVANLSHYLTERTKILAIGQMSNVTGGCPDLANTLRIAHEQGVIVVVDGAQGIVHSPLDVQALDVDFYAFSGHKLYGPTGIGALYGRGDLLEKMGPWQGGGKMLQQASFNGFTPQPFPQRFEAGTPHIAGVLGMGSLFEWLHSVDLVAAEHHAISLANSAYAKLAMLPGFRSYRAGENSLLPFNFDGVHHSDMVSLISEQGIAIRSGQHCAQPLMQALNVSGTLRASFAPYNNQDDVDALCRAVEYALNILND